MDLPEAQMLLNKAKGTLGEIDRRILATGRRISALKSEHADAALEAVSADSESEREEARILAREQQSDMATLTAGLESLKSARGKALLKKNLADRDLKEARQQSAFENAQQLAADQLVDARAIEEMITNLADRLAKFAESWPTLMSATVTGRGLTNMLAVPGIDRYTIVQWVIDQLGAHPALDMTKVDPPNPFEDRFGIAVERVHGILRISDIDGFQPGSDDEDWDDELRAEADAASEDEGEEITGIEGQDWEWVDADELDQEGEDDDQAEARVSEGPEIQPRQ